jgi:hypothetical protein
MSRKRSGSSLRMVWGLYKVGSFEKLEKTHQLQDLECGQ